MPSLQQFSKADLKTMANGFDHTIAAGGFGIIYHGQLPDGTLVAVKRFTAAVDLEHFQREVDAVVAFRHPSIVPVVGWCYEETARGAVERAIVFPLLTPLDTAVLHRFSDADRALLFQQVGDALAHMHMNDCIHRDIKPDNILVKLAPDGGLERAYLADLGLMSRLAPDADSVATSGTHTLNFLDPCGGREARREHDIYAFGVTVLCIYAKVMRPGQQGGADLVGRVPAAVANAVAPMLQKELSARPDAAGFGRVIGQILTEAAPSLLSPGRGHHQHLTPRLKHITPAGSRSPGAASGGSPPPQEMAAPPPLDMGPEETAPAAMLVLPTATVVPAAALSPAEARARRAAAAKLARGPGGLKPYSPTTANKAEMIADLTGLSGLAAPTFQIVELLYVPAAADDDVVLACAANCPELTHLNLRCTDVTDVSINAIAARCPRLVLLNTQGCLGVTDASITAIAERCPQLADLNLRGCTEVSDRSIAALAANCPNFLKMNVRSSGATDATIRMVAERCIGLTHLNVDRCQGVSDEGIEAIAKYCTGLVEVGVRGCVNVSAALKERLEAQGVKVLQ
jgi:hypothetical protein